ncbi:hypothetical protein Glove_736g6 [Diversispora epigaea]|uniref:Uncharacterized protein n=1 Tax=Diversispora epigaea TaxID=1348612 RepID=A0A397G637_9GLOM|nr:hypothetical protein Glove_736g6 [Diversispora epigaea]
MKIHSAQVIRYRGGGSDNYSSNSDKYSDNISECESENCNDYDSDHQEIFYIGDTETSTIKFSVFHPPKVEEQMSNLTISIDQINLTYSRRQEKFDNKFTQMDLLNRIREIASLPARDMLNNKGSLKNIHLWDYLLPNNGAKEGISLLDTYMLEELTNKLVIQVKQGKYRKFSVVDGISEVYDLSGIHKSIDGELPLRAVIDIDALRKYMESEKVNARDIFIHICYSYIRVLYMILDCSWEEIFEELIITTSSNSNKCSYHLLYAPALLIDYQELKQFIELVYKLTGEKYGKFIDRGLPGRNFCLRLIGSAKKNYVKRILKFSLDNGWDELNHTRVQPPTSVKCEVKPRILNYPDYLGSWDIKEKDSQWYVYFNRKTYLECPICKHTHDKDQQWFGRTHYDGTFIVKCFQQNRDESGKIFNDPSIAEKIQQKNKNNISLLISYKIKEVYEERYVKSLSKKSDVYVGSQ